MKKETVQKMVLIANVTIILRAITNMVTECNELLTDKDGKKLTDFLLVLEKIFQRIQNESD